MSGLDEHDRVHVEKSLACARFIEEMTRGNKKPDGSFYAKNPKNMADDSIAEIARAARTIVGRLLQISSSAKREDANG